jgi:magnesium-transporting ATPase (P-type)
LSWCVASRYIPEFYQIWVFSDVSAWEASVRFLLVVLALLTKVIQMHGNSKRLSKLAESEGEVEVVSCGESRICSSLHLVPGDVIVVKQGLMHADLVLISGEVGG